MHRGWLCWRQQRREGWRWVVGIRLRRRSGVAWVEMMETEVEMKDPTMADGGEAAIIDLR